MSEDVETRKQLMAALHMIGMTGDDPIAFLETTGMGHLMPMIKSLAGESVKRLEQASILLALGYLYAQREAKEQTPFKGQAREDHLLIGLGVPWDGSKDHSVVILGMTPEYFERLLRSESPVVEREITHPINPEHRVTVVITAAESKQQLSAKIGLDTHGVEVGKFIAVGSRTVH